MSFERLVTRYDGKGIEDAGITNSAEMKQFFKDFKKELKQMGEFDVEKVELNHYDVSGFLRQGEKHVYFTLNIPRGGYPMEMGSKRPMTGILIRTAKDTHDYHGGANHFTSYKDFEKDVKKLFEEEDK